MRVLLFATLAFASAWAVAPAQAQTYDPRYPVCLHVYSRINYFDCSYTSLAQCNVSASGRSAQCDVNPYYAPASRPAARRRGAY